MAAAASAAVHLLLFIATVAFGQEIINTRTFPDDFLFGTASAAYQIEGAWNSDGKGESNWDRFTHLHPELIDDQLNGDVACDSYNKYKDDIALLKDLGVDFYRFSLAWTRILPTGYGHKINRAGIDYYNNVIDDLLAHNITPMVTLYHWDLPQYLEDLGGFTNPLLAEWFHEYARICFQEFGDRVKIWTTFNEPKQLCLGAYAEGRFPPGVKLPGIAEYLCAHNLLKAHARAYHLYNDTFREAQKGKIGIVLECGWYEPASESKEDVEAAERMRQFVYGWFANPIFSSTGGYPPQMADAIASRSKDEGFRTSRLPTFTPEEINYIKGTSDYLGANHYSTLMTKNVPRWPIGEPSYPKDTQVKTWFKDEWTGHKYLRDVPWGFRKVLKWIKDAYQNPEIYILENGYPGNVSIHDPERINYHIGYLSSMLDAIYKDEVNVKLYTFWSLLDTYEWNNGYTIFFGLYYVNFSDPLRPRIPRDSVEFYKTLIKNRRLPPSKIG